jgi:hypothetical protein
MQRGVSDMWAVLSLCMTLIPLDIPMVERVDALELNHLYDEQGKLVFDQWIGWDLSRESEYRVQWWFFAKSGRCMSKRHRMVASVDGRIIMIDATSFCETWTQYDPELHDRKFHPKNRRRGLHGVYPSR